MSSPLAADIVGLYSAEATARFAAAKKIYLSGCALADEATRIWRGDPALSALLGAHPMVTVGLAVEPSTFARIHQANGSPNLAEVPPEQDAREFELHFPEHVDLDVLTTRDPIGQGSIARFLSKFGEGLQQVEYRCSDVDRASAVLKEHFGIAPVYRQARAGAGNTRINFFLVPTSSGKVLIELYETAGGRG